MTLRYAVWRKLNDHLIDHSFVLLVLGSKYNTLLLLTIAQWSSGGSLIGS
jgi:hypothetical protein